MNSSPHHDSVTPGIPRAILSAYELGHITAFSLLESYGNDNWLITSGDGRYVLRRLRMNANAERIAFQVALQQHLTDAGFATPALIKTGTGQGSVVDDGGATWMCFGYVAGTEYDFARAEQAADAGRTLARFHRLAGSFRAVGPGPEYKAPLRACWADPASDVTALSELLGAAAADDLADLRVWWDEALAAFPLELLYTLPAGWIHGDYHGRNMAFAGDRVAAVFDFDDFDRGPYVFDVAFGFFKFGRPSRQSLEIRPPYARAFLAGYESVRQLTDEERAALPLMVWLGYPPHARNYRYWRDRIGAGITGRFQKELAEMRARRATMARIGPYPFA
jgi:homoserine kinase type II